MKRLFKVAVWSIVLSASLLAQTQSPRIIFSDLQSGPNSGGLNNKGAIVTVYGFSFGAGRGASSLTVGGAAVDNYLQWSDTKISFQLGAAAVSGNIVVNVAGAGSNGVPFTVRPGRIYVVSPAGNDANAGTFTAPWRRVVKAKNTAVAGDIVYLMNGVNENALESSSATVVLAKSGTSTLPIALVAYPGATATIGSATGQQYGIRTTSTASYWVLAGLTLRGSLSALSVSNSSNWRVIANDLSCPNGSSSGACVDFSAVKNISVYGNRVHDVGLTTSASLKFYQGVLFHAGSNGIDFGWNEIANVHSCRALQFSSDTTKLYNITVDNNLIHDSRCDGINFANVDPALGPVRAYNNVVYRAGTGPAPGGVESNYACINVGAAGTAPVLLQNNTLYDCGRRANNDSGAISASAPVTVVNNIIVAAAGEKYLAPNSLPSRFSGSNNLFFGAGAAPGFSSASLNADPGFVDPVNANFRLQAGSPAIDRGASNGISRDMIQALRPSGAAYDMGAFEFASAVSPPQQGALGVNPQSLAFGNIVIGSSASQNVTVSNTSSLAVTISNLSVTGTGFSQSGATLPLTLAAGQSAAIAVKFVPLAAGSITGALQITSNATNPGISIALNGTGTAVAPQQGTLTLSTQSLAFSSVLIGASANQPITLSNASTVAVTLSNVAATGTGFSQSGPAMPLTLTPGQTATFTATFAPQIAGPAAGSLQITSNASNSSVAVALSGSGSTVQHSVDISWGVSVPAASGYDVYRSPQSGGPYTRLNAAPITVLTFTDSTVSSGVTYFYIVTSVAADGTESGSSNQATAVVPNP